MRTSSYNHPYSIHSLEHKILLSTKKGDTKLAQVLSATSRVPYEPSAQEHLATTSALKVLCQSSYLKESTSPSGVSGEPTLTYGLLPEGRVVLKDLDERASWFATPVEFAPATNVWSRETLGAPNKTVDRPGSKRAYNIPSLFGRRPIDED
jgi:hypothetical protein